MLPVPLSVAPGAMVTLPAPFSAPFTVSVPLLTTSGPVKAFVAENVRLPAPVLMSPPSGAAPKAG